VTVWDVDERGYGSAQVWNGYFTQLREQRRDLDWRDQWTGAFLPIIEDAACRRVLDLGCGTGNEVRALGRLGLSAVGLDFSDAALLRARDKGVAAPLVRADMAQPLPFADGVFDAVMSNVAFHYFDDRLTRSILAELRRVVRRDGLLLLHVNAIEHRAVQERRGVVVREIGPDHVVNADGGTSRFFSRDYLRDVLAAWRDVCLQFVPIGSRAEPSKFVWRAVARR
jgi:SAM-dependent methyltransferase